MKEIICTLRDIKKQYPKQSPTLDGISLDLYAGEVLGIRGNNGAGKSTLLNILAGILEPDSGEWYFSDEILVARSFVPQELSLYESLSGEENLKFWGLAFGMTRDRIGSRSRSLLEELGLTDKAKSPVSSYSGGMKRKLHLATALMKTPKLLLLDEPTVGSDRSSTQQIMNMLRHLNEQGTTIVLTTHQSGELESISDRVLSLGSGKIKEV